MPILGAPIVDDLLHEIVFSSTRSSGPGGQNVNKVNTRVTIRFDIANSEVLDENQKAILTGNLTLTNDGILIISAQDTRSQLKNKEECLNKFRKMILDSFFVKKKRRPTKPSRSSIKKRLDSKKKHAQKKQNRRNPPD